MQDYIKRILVVVIMAACIGMLFIGGITTNAEMNLQQPNEQNWSWPITGIITDTFGTRNGRHKGLDIAAPIGEKIYTVEEGIVKKSYYSSSSYGNVIFIEHPNGYETVYAHLSKRLVQEGDQIERGQIIGEIGSTGRSTGPHLHFEVHNGEWNSSRDNAINPLSKLTNEQKLVVISIEEEERRIELLKSNLTKGPIEMIEQTVEATTVQTDSVNLTKVTVKEGESLWEISNELNVSMDDIKKWNKLDSSTILAGQTLHIYHEVNEKENNEN